MSKIIKDLKELDQISYQIIGAAMKVHSELGPGLLESAYETCLKYELVDRGLFVERQKALPIIFKGIEMENAYRLDLLVAHSIIIELKVVEDLAPIHQAQLMTYLKLSGLKLGLLLNFNVVRMKNGITRIVM